MKDQEKKTRYDERAASSVLTKALWDKVGYLWLCFGPVYVCLSVIRYYYDDLIRFYSVFWLWYAHRTGLWADVSVFVAAIGFGYGLFYWRKHAARSYGSTEIALGAFSSMLGMHALATDTTNALLKVAAGIYIVVRGLDNYSKGVEVSRARVPS